MAFMNSFPFGGVSRRIALLWVVFLWTGMELSLGAHETGDRARYLVLTGRNRTPPPFGSVDFIYGPRETVGAANGQWWELEARKEPDQTGVPLFQLRGLTEEDPLAPRSRPLQFVRYQLRLPETAETLEYRDVHSGQALLPAWRDFEALFVPRRNASSHTRNGFPETAEYLGQVLTLTHVGRDPAWPDWSDLKVLDLDRELLVGTSRNFKDSEGHRLPQKPERQDYHYVPFVQEDYRTMIEAGINLFTLRPSQEAWVRSEPVFYIRDPSANPPSRYPADLYRANYLGKVMFVDEPSIQMVGDPNVHRTLKYFSDAAALIEKRTRSTYFSADNYGAFAMEKAFLKNGVNLGDMRLMQPDYPSWETLYETAFYQLAGGVPGIVHEGRYQLKPFDEAVSKWTGLKRAHTAGEMFRYYFAFLRGAARHFGGYWGTSIYGQADPALSPEAVTLAYDMGARYLWFWTSDHDHHLPWPEQLSLARTIRRHAREHPRPSLFAKPVRRDAVIVIPAGYFLSLENLWWVRVLDAEGKNEASQRYRRLMQRAWTAVYGCFERGEDFDFTVDDGQPIADYGKIIRIDDKE
jgi:hypothetical protein